MSKCLEVQDNLVSFVKGELNAAERLFFQTHLGECNQCRKVQSEINRLNGLLHFKEPADILSDKPGQSEKIWENIWQRIEHQPPAAGRLGWLKIIWKPAAAVLLAGLGVYSAFVFLSPPTMPALTVRLDGVTVIPSSSLLNHEDVPLTARLYQTSNNGTGEIGSVTLKNNSKLIYYKDHLYLEEGEINVNIFESLPRDGKHPLLITTDAASVLVEGTEFIVRAVFGLETSVVVTRGRVKFFNKHGAVFISEGFASSAAAGFAPSLPVKAEQVEPAEQKLPVLKISGPETCNLNAPFKLKFSIINSDDSFWFAPFNEASSYLFIKVVDSENHQFYARVNLLKDREMIPVGFKQSNGLMTWPAGLVYQLETVAEGVFLKPGSYRITGVYGAVAPCLPVGRESRYLGHKVWQGLIESESMTVIVK